MGHDKHPAISDDFDMKSSTCRSVSFAWIVLLHESLPVQTQAQLLPTKQNA